MKRAQFKKIVKECLVEILRDNMEMFSEGTTRSAKKSASRKVKGGVKRSLMSLLENEEPTMRPQQRQQRPQQRQQMPPQQRQQQPPLDMNQQMILSAASTMNQQNAGGEMSSRGVDGLGGFRQQPQQQQYDDYNDGYGNEAYENAPMPHDSGGGGYEMPMQEGYGYQQEQAPQQSHWAQIADRADVADRRGRNSVPGPLPQHRDQPQRYPQQQAQPQRQAPQQAAPASNWEKIADLGDVGSNRRGPGLTFFSE